MSYLTTQDTPGAGRAWRSLGWLRFAAEYVLWLLVFSSLTLIFALAVLAPALAQIQAKVDAREEKGFGRLIFHFDRMPGYKSEIASGVLVLTFAEPVSADIVDLPEKSPRYVAIARADPDGRAIRLALTQSYQVNLMEAGKQLFVDILPADWKGMFPGLPAAVVKALARQAAEAERRALEEARQRAATKDTYKLKVHLARHPTFTRIVFDWNKFVTVRLARTGAKVRVEFGRQAKADLTRLNVDPPPHLKGAKSVPLERGMAIAMSVDKTADVRGFREGLTYVVDLSGTNAVAEAAAENAKRLAQADKSPAKAAPPPAERDETKIDGAAAARPGAPAPSTIPALTTELTEFIPDRITPEQYGDSAKIFEPPRAVAAGVVRPHGPPAPQPLAAETPAKVPRAALKTVAPPTVAAPAIRADKTAPDTTAPVKVRVEAEGPNLRLTFPFTGPVAAAVFRRGRAIWLVFDTGQPLDRSALDTKLKNKVESLGYQSDGRAQYFRLSMRRPWLTYMAAEENSWIVTIGDMIVGKAQPLSLNRSLRADKRSVITIPFKKPGRVHWLDDPELGDRIAVVTAFAPPRNFSKPQEFVEFTAIPTAHGIAIRPKSEDLGVRLRLDEVLITRHKGLTLSAGNKHQYAPGKKALDPSARLGFLDFAGWQVRKPSVLLQRVHELQRVIAVSQDGEKNALRLTLARLYLASGLTAESLGIMKRMRQTDPTVQSDPAYNVLRGAANVLMNRAREARKDLDVHALASDPDAALWRGLLEVKDKDWEAALRHFRAGGDAIGAYRADMQARFRLGAARAALELSRVTRAADELDGAPQSELPPGLEADAKLLRGRYLASIGRIDEALEAFDAVLKSSNRPSVAEAELSTIALLLKTKKIPVTEAIKSLERLQLIWRGDDVELRTLRLLASLYVGEKRHRDAFLVMKNAVMAYPKEKIALGIQDDMKQVFRDLFLHDASRALEPVEALSLYYDYRELTPVGRVGDEMIRHLADRLIDVDLLDQAAELLDYQVNKRLSGAARAQVATRLAMVHLMNRKPEMALKAIRQTRQAGLPSALLRSRNLLEARAMGELGRAEAAVEILSAYKGEDVERQKADALWNAQHWQSAGEQLEKLMGSRWQEPEPLSPAERFDVMRGVIAYSLADDQFALDRMSKKYYAQMLKTSDAEAFALVTRPVKGESADFRKLAKEIAATDTLDAFMVQFRKRYDMSRDRGKAADGGEDDGSTG